MHEFGDSKVHHRAYLAPRPLPRGKLLPFTPRLAPLPPLCGIPPRMAVVVCLAVDVVLGVTLGPIVLRRGVAFRLAKLASAANNVASPSPAPPLSLTLFGNENPSCDSVCC
jgi:hypothetical protein